MAQTAMGESTSSTEIRLVRETLQEMQRDMVTTGRFERHEDIDQKWRDVTDVRLSAMDKWQANFMGKLAVISGILLLGIPILTNWLASAHAAAKP